jgi:pyridoxamine 5'-phosphate oxidase
MDPLARFAELFAQARVNPCHDATAMTLATVGDDGRPSARVVLLKGVDDGGFVFYTNTRSRKGRELDAHPAVALTLWWPHNGWQVRVEGDAARVTDAEADAYFASRARGSRAELEGRLAEYTTRFAGKAVPRPPHWTGYRVTPTTIELWKNRDDRLHDREEYRRESPSAPWTMRLLNP